MMSTISDKEIARMRLPIVFTLAPELTSPTTVQGPKRKSPPHDNPIAPDTTINYDFDCDLGSPLVVNWLPR
jgi:hypothetical protein